MLKIELLHRRPSSLIKSFFDLTVIVAASALFSFPAHSAEERISIGAAITGIESSMLRECVQNSVSGLRFADELTRLECRKESNSEHIDSLAGLEQFSGLIILSINWGKLSDISPIGELTKLEQLVLDNGDYGQNFSPLTSLVNLQSLRIVIETGDLDWLTSLSTLSELHLTAFLPGGGEPTLDLNKLSGLINLEVLGIYHGRYSDLTPLANLSKLKWLQFGNADVQNWDPIASLQMLEELRVYARGYHFDLSLLSEFPLLNTAQIATSYEGILEDLVELPPDLVHFGIWYSNVTDFSWVSRLTKLKTLHLGGNEETKITDLSDLASVDYLESLDLWYGNVQRIGTAFDTWRNGTVIQATGNPLTCADLARARENASVTIIFDSECVSELNTDSDGDSVPDDEDAFPNDPAASVDTDGDGKPDYWNEGYSANDSTSSPQLVLDNDDDNDQVLDDEDAYPYDWDRSELEGSKLRSCDSSYCLVQTVEPVKDEIQYLYRVSSEAKDYEFLHAESGWTLEEGGGSSSTNFDFFDGTKWSSYRDQSGSVADTTRLSLEALFQQSQGTVRLRLSEGSGDGWVALSLVKAGARPIVIFIMQDSGYRLSEFSQTARAVSFTRPEPGTGNHRNSDQCSTFDYEGIGLPAFSPFSFNLMSPSRFIPIGNEGRAWNLRAAGSEIFICADTPVGNYDLTYEVVDGAGGKLTFPLTMQIEEGFTDGGSAEWLDPIPSSDECKSAYCLKAPENTRNENGGEHLFYYFNLMPQPSLFPFEHDDFQLNDRDSGATEYSFVLETINGLETISVDGSLTEAQRNAMQSAIVGGIIIPSKPGKSPIVIGWPSRGKTEVAKRSELNSATIWEAGLKT